MQTESTVHSQTMEQLGKCDGIQSKSIGAGSKEGGGYHQGNPPAYCGPYVGERDPNGIDPKSGGAKLDAGKPCIWRGAIDYFPGAIRAVATISTFGATKYSWKGWETVPEGFERYSDAMVRHLIAESAEGPWDNDSGMLHAAHAAWGALARLEFLLREKTLHAAGVK